MARPEGFEPPTYGFEARRSIHLSYGRVLPHPHPRTPGDDTTAHDTARAIGLQHDPPGLSLASILLPGHARSPEDALARAQEKTT